MKNNSLPKVFISDASQRKAIPIIRSLGQKGIEVIAGDSARCSMGFYSKYCSQRVIYPSPVETPNLFIEWLIDYFKNNPGMIFFSIDETTMDPVTMHLTELRNYTNIPVVDYLTYMKARNKSETIHIALEHGITCPKTYFISNLEEIKTLAKTIDFPVVIKPCISHGSHGIAYVQSKNNLSAAYFKIHSRYPFPLIQEFIPAGDGIFGVEALFNKDSIPRAAFVHRRIREYPVSGGPSTLRESVYEPEIMEMGLSLLKALKWYGVAMVEFKIDPRDKKPKLMEVNPKFWGSIQLPIVSGIDFPYLLYRMAKEGDIESNFKYDTGILCRWLLPGDILNFLTNPNRFKLKPSFFQFRAKNLYYDILSLDDPSPILGMFISYIVQALRGKIWRDIHRRW